MNCSSTSFGFVNSLRLACGSLGLALAIVSLAQAQTAGAAYTTGYRYDGGARLVGVIKPSVQMPGPRGEYAADGRYYYPATRTTYNAQGLVSKVETGALLSWQAESIAPENWADFIVNTRVETTYDIFGRKLTEKTSGTGASGFGSSGNQAGVPITLTQYTYDSAGRVRCTAQRMNPNLYGSLPESACALGVEGVHGPDRITRTTYDTESRPLQVEKGVGTSAAIIYATYTYYPNGPQESVTDANGNKTYYAYDGFARLSRWYFPSPTIAGQYNTSDYEEYGYDPNGNRIALRKRDGRVIVYEYDALNRLRKEVFPPNTLPDIYYQYDLRGLQLSARYGSDAGAGLISSYDGFGRLDTSITSVGSAARTIAYKYDLEGNRTEIRHPDGQAFRYQYDGLGRLTSVAEVTTSFAPVSQAYDDFGRRTTLTRRGLFGNTTASIPVVVTNFSFDEGSRLKNMAQNLAGTAYDETRGFSYNPASQVNFRSLSNGAYDYKQLSLGATSYASNGLNQYTTLTSDSSVAIEHDLNGNMTFDGSRRFAFDLLNRLVSVSEIGKPTITLAYDPKGRLSQVSGGPSGTTEYLYDGDALIAEFGSSGQLLRRYVHGSGIDDPLVVYEGTAVGHPSRRFIVADNQGSVIAHTDAAGNVLNVNTYDPYGVPATVNSGRFQYTGQTVIPDVQGLYHYKARTYHPGLGRFLQRDPIGYKDDLDLYTYVANDPMNHVDPSGNSLLDAGFLVFDGIKLAAALYTGVGVRHAAADFAMSAVGFISPVPGTGQALKAMAAAEKGVTLTLHAKEGWTAAQKAEALAKVAHLDQEAKKGVLAVTRNPDTSTKASKAFRKENNVAKNRDVDHKTDRQLGGKDVKENLQDVDSSVNRSLGSQIQHQTKDLPENTKICSVIILGCN